MGAGFCLLLGQVCGDEFDHPFFRFFEGLVLSKAEYYDDSGEVLFVTTSRSTGEVSEDGSVFVYTARFHSASAGFDGRSVSTWMKSGKDSYVANIVSDEDQRGTGELTVSGAGAFEGEITWAEGSREIFEGMIKDGNRMVLESHVFVHSWNLWLNSREVARRVDAPGPVIPRPRDLSFYLAPGFSTLISQSRSPL